jgi:hypothetical protein
LAVEGSWAQAGKKSFSKSNSLSGDVLINSLPAVSLHAG